MDASDRDGPSNTTKTNLLTGLPVKGLYMPDGISSYASGGQTYYVTANEGDDRDDFLATDETIVVADAEGDVLIDETVSVANADGELEVVEEDVALIEGDD